MGFGPAVVRNFPWGSGSLFRSTRTNITADLDCYMPGWATWLCWDQLLLFMRTFQKGPSSQSTITPGLSACPFLPGHVEPLPGWKGALWDACARMAFSSLPGFLQASLSTWSPSEQMARVELVTSSSPSGYTTPTEVCFLPYLGNHQ